MRKVSINFLLAIIGIMGLALLPALPASAVTSYHQFGTPENDQVNVSAANQTGVYVAGNTDGSLPGQTSAGNTDAYVRKFDHQGNEVWTRQFGTNKLDELQAIAVDNTGVYVGGSSNPDAFVRKYDLNGNEVWTKHYNFGDLSYTYGIVIEGQNMYLLINTLGALPGQSNAGTSYDMIVRKTDLNGNEIWSQQLGSPATDQANALAVQDGNIYVAGFTNDSLPGQTLLGWADAFLVKYTNDGALAWTRQFGTASGWDFANGLTTDASGVYVTGVTDGTLATQTNAGGHDGFLQKFDFDGNTVWTRQFGEVRNDEMRSVTMYDSTLYAVGVYDQAAVTATYDADGNFIKTDRYPVSGEGGSAAYGVAVVDDTVYSSGLLSGAFPGQTYNGGADAYLIVESPQESQQTITYLSPANVWMSRGLLDLGLRADIKAEAYINDTLLTSGQINSIVVGSGIFGSAALIDIPFAPVSPTVVPEGATVSIRLSARNACDGSPRSGGTLRLWYNDAQVSSHFDATIDTVSRPFYLRNDSMLATSPGSGPRQQKTIQAGTRCSDFKVFDTWTTAL